MTLDQPKKDIRCMVCREEFIGAVLKKSNEQVCPVCKTVVPPMWIKNDGYIKMNWDEIRMVAIYAQRWVGKFDTTKPANLEYIKAFRNIIEIIKLYQPKTGRTLDPKEYRSKAIPSPYFN